MCVFSKVAKKQRVFEGAVKVGGVVFVGGRLGKRGGMRRKRHQTRSKIINRLGS